MNSTNLSTLAHGFQRRPAVRVALLFILGIVIAEWSLPDAHLAFAVWAACILISVIGVVRWKESPVTAVALLFAIVAMGVTMHSFSKLWHHSSRIDAVEEYEADIEGVVEEYPLRRGEMVQLLISGRRAGTNANEADRRFLVYGKWLHVERIETRLKPGAAIRVPVLLQPFPRPRNPGEFDYGRSLELNDIHAVGRLSTRAPIEVLESQNSGSLLTLPVHLRCELSRTLDHLHSSEASAFLKGILLADRSKIAADVKEAFVATGTVHLLAVSGLHVGIVAVVFYGAFGLLRFPRKLIAIATMLGLCGYVVLTGAPPSVVRASVMASVVLAGSLLERKVDIYQSLAVAALILLFWDTNNLFHVGFQLSFAAVISIVYLYPRLNRIVQAIPERYEEVKRLQPVFSLFVVSLAAQLGTLPFTAIYFERVPIVSLLANMVAVPVVGLNVMLGFASLVVALVSPWLAQFYAEVNEVLVSFLLGFVRAGARVPYAFVSTSGFSEVNSVYYYLALIGVSNFHHPAYLKRVAIGLLVVANVHLYSTLAGAGEQHLRVTMLDVGQGDAIVVDFPNGQKALIDVGPRSPNHDAGERIVLPYLRRQGVNRVDHVFLSHPHSDHLGGTEALLNSLSVGRIIEPPIEGTSGLYRSIRSGAERVQTPVLQKSAGDTIVIDPTVRLYVLHPSRTFDGTKNLNNASIVVKLVFGATSFLFVGDAEEEAEARIVERYGPLLKSEVLKVGHHGSRTSSTLEFLAHVKPTLALVSVGRKNKFRHPSSDVIRRMEQEGARVLRTDREGAIMVETDGARIRLVDWRRR